MPRITSEIAGIEPFPQCHKDFSHELSFLYIIYLYPGYIMPQKMQNHKVKHKANTVLVDHRNIVGIDIGKRKHAATALTPKGAVIASLATFENNKCGVDQLERQILAPATNRSKPMVVMEATGMYWNALHDELLRRGYACVVLNPIQTNARSARSIRKTQTDRIDSETIARTVLAGDAQSTLIPDEPMHELRLLVRHRWRLIRSQNTILLYAISLVDRVFPEFEDVFSKPFLTSVRTLIREIGLTPNVLVANKRKVRELLEKTSRKRLTPETINDLLKRAKDSIGTRQGETVVNEQLRMIVDYLDFMDSQVEQINKELRLRMEELQPQIMTLGIGPEIAATILAESGAIERFAGPREYSAYCGLDPSVRDSGDSIRGASRISKRGSPLLRWAMYMTAIAVYKKHRDFTKIYVRHTKQQPKGQRQKGHRYALIAVAHKVARVIWRLMKDDRPFNKTPPKREN
jgi:transposase